MSGGQEHIALNRSLSTITVGHRHRTDLGDIDELAESIRREGILQPIAITPDGVLLSGRRRLAALERLGEKKVPVWVVDGVSDKLTALLAEQAEQVHHKPLTETEKAALYRELKQILAEDAVRRQQSSRFGAETPAPAGASGGVVTTPPSLGHGKTREQSALMVTGRKSQTSLEQVNNLQGIEADATLPGEIRTFAREQLALIDEHRASIEAAHARTQALVEFASDVPRDGDFDVPDDFESLARAALEKANAELSAKRTTRRQQTRKLREAAATPLPAIPYPVRAFTNMWRELDGWWEHYDADTLAESVTGDEWDEVERVVAKTMSVMDEVRSRRAGARPEPKRDIA